MNSTAASVLEDVDRTLPRPASRFLAIFSNTPLRQFSCRDGDGLECAPPASPTNAPDASLHKADEPPTGHEAGQQTAFSPVFLAPVPLSAQWLRRVVSGALLLLTAASLSSVSLNALAAGHDSADTGDALSAWLATTSSMQPSAALAKSALRAINAQPQAPAPVEASVDPQDAQAAQEHQAYQHLVTQYSPWLRLAPYMTLREHRQNARAAGHEDQALHRLQDLQSIRAQAFAEQQDELREHNPSQFAALSSQLALRQASWRQLSSAQIDASLDDREHAELHAQDQIQALSDSSTAFFGDGFTSCVASISTTSLSEDGSSDHSLFSQLDPDFQRAFAAGHELGHCESPINFDPANAGHFQALWAKLASASMLGDTLSTAGPNARLAFSSLLNESSADAYAAMLSRLSVGARAAESLPVVIQSRETAAQSESLDDAESHRTAPALRWIQAAMVRSGGRGPTSPAEMDQWALEATRASAKEWLAHYNAPSQAIDQLVNQALNADAVRQARNQALNRLAQSQPNTSSSSTPARIGLEEEASAWTGSQGKAQALAQLRLRLDEARTAGIAAPALVHEQVAMTSRRRGP